jgi:hypothetical protein
MNTYRFGLRDVARWMRGSRIVLVACAIVGIAASTIAVPAWAQEFPRGATVKAVGFYDQKGVKEQLVAVVVHPVGNGSEPRLWTGPRIATRPLGTGRPERFAGSTQGMKRKSLLDKGRLQAAIYSLSTVDGDYVNVVTYLLGGNQIVVDDPANLKPIEGSGGSDGGGGGGGDGGGGH